VDIALIVAGTLAILGAAIHGAGGEVLVVKKLSPATLPSTSFGGPMTTKLMIHATWHMTTVAFLSVGCALLLSGTVIDGDPARALAVLAAGACTGFAAIAVGLGVVYTRSTQILLRHPGPAVLTATAALAWWGVL